MTTPVAQRQAANGWSAHEGHAWGVAPEEQPLPKRKSAKRWGRHLSDRSSFDVRELAASVADMITLPSNVELTRLAVGQSGGAKRNES